MKGQSPSMIPMAGTSITMENGDLNVPNNPVIHFIEGDGIGIDITPVMIDVVDASVEKAYSGEKKIHWEEVLAGEKAFNAVGEWLPNATLDAMKNGLVSIKGPLTTPVGGGIRSLNVALRQKLDLFACVRPVRWYAGTPSPVRDPGAVSLWDYALFSRMTCAYVIVFLLVIMVMEEVITVCLVQ